MLTGAVAELFAEPDVLTISDHFLFQILLRSLCDSARDVNILNIVLVNNPFFVNQVVVSLRLSSSDHNLITAFQMSAR